MTIKVQVQNSTINQLSVDVHFSDKKLYGEKAYVRLIRVFNVLDSRGNDTTEVLHEDKIKIQREKYSFVFNKTCNNVSSSGLELKHKIEVVVAKDWAFDQKETKNVGFNLQRKETSRHPGLVMDPKDHYNLLKNFKAIDNKQRILIIGAGITALVIILLNSILGIHDQFSPESLTWFYSHYESDGDAQSPLLLALGINGTIAGATWVFIKSKLKKYMLFYFKQKPSINPKTIISARELIGGRPRVDLKQIRIKVVAGNFVHGSYERGSGSSQRTVWFHKAIKAITLFEQSILHVPAHADLSNYLEGDIHFSDVFDSLLPTMLSDKTGVSLDWEVQLIHDHFIDQELQQTEVKCPATYFQAFHEGKKKEAA
jgi:hypothetical protein